jgi:hypothetical protein
MVYRGLDIYPKYVCLRLWHLISKVWKIMILTIFASVLMVFKEKQIIKDSFSTTP